MKQLYIVAAAGSGKRMGLGSPKQFLEFHGEPVFIKTLKVIDGNDEVDEIIVVTKKEYMSKVREYLAKFDIKKVVAVVEGGKERQDSIYNAIKEVDDIENYIIGVQDGVRPFIKPEYIRDAKMKLVEDNSLDGIIVGVPVKDTIKIIKNGIIEKTPQRSTLFAAQTPQVFRGEVIKRAYREAEKSGFVGTDDASLVEFIGGRVGTVQGSYDNIKITTVEDLLHFK